MTEQGSSETEDRKDDHIQIVQERDVETTGTGFEDVQLVHEALPELDYNAIDPSIEFLGHELSAPIFIESMTGGHPNTTELNRALARAAGETGIAMGLGSQRAGLELDDDSVLKSYTVVRDAAPDAFIYGNLGAAQLREYDIEMVEQAVEMIDADALAVHLNFLQEATQPEGDVDGRNCVAAIGHVSEDLSVPIIVKETGNGISGETARKLTAAGVDAIDVAGKGGTTWSGIEAYRAAAANAPRQQRIGTLFREWGIPTAASTIECVAEHECVIASGGVRTGLDVAKVIALGALAGGLAKPFLKPATEGPEAVIERVEDLIAELQTAMFITGSRTIEDLQQTEYVLQGKTREYVEQRPL
ncbi:type 2 isopentenyl-diphosphate Delta-isomerase [Halobacterium salinarum]|uniref:Isopentenyl-diphosphate delta-isomerase n=1 Tax=Halohasta litorea TaxID=869891 RepID=A0ABD6DBX8_9EURY|nr:MULTISPECIES: type 2 isopentenyl-diphosphate Delta-isomerase [Halobacteria]MDL0122407.1 type 2 isopentenyl-diphosphate Delta-isomerase [Halobacterium salinarum]MDL0137447.1 type 2 isopentenyl-diphosphate Delta-isomerase [Halobacterium salinarum]MDL0140473.1 type 2 isopentenyl-diphosphate Delta-isomerase [Halobacterium salinarum]OYR61607.1 type 2 isopentenyl-diphosphate Delta-isomerase [Halorubrum sp. E3]